MICAKGSEGQGRGHCLWLQFCILLEDWELGQYSVLECGLAMLQRTAGEEGKPWTLKPNMKHRPKLAPKPYSLNHKGGEEKGKRETGGGLGEGGTRV